MNEIIEGKGNPPIQKSKISAKQIPIKDSLLISLITQGGDFTEKASIEEIEKAFNKYGNEINFTEYLNNFYYTVAKAVQKDRETIIDKVDNSEKIRENTKGQNHSPKYLEQTIKGFHDDITKAIQTTGLDIEDIQKAYKNYKNEKNFREWKEKVYKKIRPAYIELRKQGYGNYDLTY